MARNSSYTDIEGTLRREKSTQSPVLKLFSDNNNNNNKERDQERQSLIRDSTSTVKVRDDLRSKENKHMRDKSEGRRHHKAKQKTFATYCTGNADKDERMIRDGRRLYGKYGLGGFQGGMRGDDVTNLMMSGSSGSVDDCPCANCSMNLGPKIFLYCLTTVGLIIFIILSSIAVYKLTPDMAIRSRFNPARFEDETKDFLSKHAKRDKAKPERRHTDPDRDMTRLQNFNDEDEKYVADTALSSELSEKHGQFQDSRESFSDRFPKWKSEARNDKMQNFIRKLMQTEEKIRSLKKSSKKSLTTLFDEDSEPLRYRRAVKRKPGYTSHRRQRNFVESVDDQLDDHNKHFADIDQTKAAKYKHSRRYVVDNVGTEHHKDKMDEDQIHIRDKFARNEKDSDSLRKQGAYYGADKDNNIEQHKEFKRSASDLTDIGLLDDGFSGPEKLFDDSNTMFVRLPPARDHSQISKKCSHSPQAANTHEKYLTHPFYKENERYDKMLKITAGNVTTTNASNWPIMTFPHLNSDDSFEPLMDENIDYHVKYSNYDNQEISDYEDGKKAYRQNEDIIEHPKETPSRENTDFREKANEDENENIEDSEKIREYYETTSETLNLSELPDDELVETYPDISKLERQLHKRKFPFFQRTTKKKSISMSSHPATTLTNATFVSIDKEQTTGTTTKTKAKDAHVTDDSTTPLKELTKTSYVTVITTADGTTESNEQTVTNEQEYKTINAKDYNGMLILTVLDSDNITYVQPPNKKMRSSHYEKEILTNENSMEAEKGNIASEFNTMEGWAKLVEQENNSRVPFNSIMSLDRLKTLHNSNGKGPMPLFFDEIETIHTSTDTPRNKQLYAEYTAKTSFVNDFYDMKLITAQKDAFDLNKGILFETGNIKDDTNEKLQKTMQYQKLMNFAINNSVIDMDITTDYFPKYLGLASTAATFKPDVYESESDPNYLQGNDLEEESEQNDFDSNNMAYYKDAALQAYSDYGVLDERKPSSEVRGNENSATNKQNLLSTSTSMYDHANFRALTMTSDVHGVVKRDLKETLNANDISSLFKSRRILSMKLNDNKNYVNNINSFEVARNNLDERYALENLTKSQDESVRNDFSEAKAAKSDKTYENEIKYNEKRYTMVPNNGQLYEPLDKQQNKRIENRDIYVLDGLSQHDLPTSTCMFNYFGQPTDASRSYTGNLNGSYWKVNSDRRNVFSGLKDKMFPKKLKKEKDKDIEDEDVSVKITETNLTNKIHKPLHNATRNQKKNKAVTVLGNGKKVKSQRSSSEDEENEDLGVKTTTVYNPKPRKFGRKYTARGDQVIPRDKVKLSGMGGAIEGITATIQSNNELLESIQSEKKDKSVASIWKGALKKIFACDTVLEPITPKLSMASITDPEGISRAEQPFSAALLGIENALRFKATSKVTTVPTPVAVFLDPTQKVKTLNREHVFKKGRQSDRHDKTEIERGHDKDKVADRPDRAETKRGHDKDKVADRPDRTESERDNDKDKVAGRPDRAESKRGHDKDQVADRPDRAESKIGHDKDQVANRPSAAEGKRGQVKDRVVKRSPEEVMLFWGDLFYDEVGDDSETEDYVEKTLNEGKAKPSHKKSTKNIRYRDRRRRRRRHKRNTKKKVWNKLSTMFQTNLLNSSTDERDEIKAADEQLDDICEKAATTLLSSTKEHKIEGRLQRDGAPGDPSNPLQLQYLLNLMGEWINYEVERRTCLELPLDLKEYLIWLTGPDSPDTHYFKNKAEDVGDELAEGDIFLGLNKRYRNDISANDLIESNIFDKTDGEYKTDDEFGDINSFEKWKTMSWEDSTWDINDNSYRKIRCDDDDQKTKGIKYRMTDSMDLELTTTSSEREDEFRFASRSDCLGTVHELEELVREFDSMTEDEKSDVPGIREYLVDQLNLLHQYMASPGSEYGHRISLEEVDDNMERKKRNAKLVSGENTRLSTTDNLLDRPSKEQRKITKSGTKKDTELDDVYQRKLSVPAMLEELTERDSYSENKRQISDMGMKKIKDETFGITRQDICKTEKRTDFPNIYSTQMMQEVENISNNLYYEGNNWNLNYAKTSTELFTSSLEL